MEPRSAVPAVIFFVCLLCATAAFAAPAAGSSGEIELENTLSQSDIDDRIDVETRLSIPDATTELEIILPEGSDVTELNGFERVEDEERTYEWTGETAEPKIDYEYEGTVRGTHGDRDGVFFVVADEWALVRTPNIGVSWRTTDTDSELTRKNTVDGEGVASTHMAYLGSYTKHTNTAAGQEFELIVPETAELHEEPGDILTVLGAAAERLSIGERDDRVFIIAAPTADHTWAPAGLQRGDGGDMWVRDEERLGTERDTWVHEYVHTRQRYDTTPETRWTIEGMADYYAALLSYETGEISYGTYADRLAKGADSKYDDVRLAERETWIGTEADYDKGSLVFAHLDRRLRAETDTTLDAVLAGLNDPDISLTQARFIEAIAAVGGDEISADAEQYTETTATPSVASQREHAAAFGGADIRYTIESTALSGPYRSGPLSESRLVSGERLETTVGVENVGDESGVFEAELRIDGETVASESGRLDPSETATFTFEYVFESPGEYDVSVGTETDVVTVEEPAEIAVVGLDADPGEATVGESVTLRATVESAADRPAVGEVHFTVDGERIATKTVRVGNGTEVVTTTVSFETAGDYEISAGDRSIGLTVEDGSSVSETTPPVIEDQAGIGAPVAVLALVAVLIARRGWSE